jgi:hypothetical protein
LWIILEQWLNENIDSILFMAVNTRKVVEALAEKLDAETEMI